MRIGGTFIVRLGDGGGNLIAGEGEWECNAGYTKREMYLGSNGPAGIVEKAQVPYCEGELVLAHGVDPETIFKIENKTIEIEMTGGGRTFQLTGAYFCGDGNVSTKGTISNARFEGMKGDFI